MQGKKESRFAAFKRTRKSIRGSSVKDVLQSASEYFTPTDKKCVPNCFVCLSDCGPKEFTEQKSCTIGRALGPSATTECTK